MKHAGTWPYPASVRIPRGVKRDESHERAVSSHLSTDLVKTVGRLAHDAGLSIGDTRRALTGLEESGRAKSVRLEYGRARLRDGLGAGRAAMKRHAPEEAVEALPLFDFVEKQALDIAPRARATDPFTSHEAAASMVECANTQRASMLRALRDAPDGLTCDEIETLLGWRYATASRRMNELVATGLAVGTIDTRPTKSGRAAVVYFANERSAR